MPSETAFKIDQETARQEFERFLDVNELEFNIEEMDAEDRAGFEGMRRNFEQAVRRGRLVLEDDGVAIFTTSDNVVLRFREPKGSDLVAMDRLKKNQDIAKKNAFIASVTGVAPVELAKMRNRDLKVADSLAMLFLA